MSPEPEWVDQVAKAERRVIKVAIQMADSSPESWLKYRAELVASVLELRDFRPWVGGTFYV